MVWDWDCRVGGQKFPIEIVATFEQFEAQCEVKHYHGKAQSCWTTTHIFGLNGSFNIQV